MDAKHASKPAWHPLGMTTRPLRLLAVELARLELELVSPVATSHGMLRRRPVLLVRVTTDRAEGVGECPALAEPTYTSEYADGAELVLGSHLIPLLLERPDLGSVEEAMGRLEVIRGHHMAKSAIEMALLDAECRAAGRSLAARIGAPRPFVAAGATVGLAEEPGRVAAAVTAAVRAGYERVKCKVAPGRDVATLAAIRREHADLTLVADANGSYRLDRPGDLEALRAFEGFGLAALEEPLEAGDLAGHAALRQLIGVPILLDESAPDLHAIESAALLGAADAVSIKPARLGGVLRAAAAVHRCGELGLSCAIGGMFETGIGRAASLAVAGLPGLDLPGDLGASDRYFKTDLTAPHVLEGGRLAVPQGPGLGVALVHEVLPAVTVRSRGWRSAAARGAS